MAEFQEDIIFEDAPDFQGDPEPKLTETNRRKLDSIVQKMIENKESDDDIKFVVEDFKKKYATRPLVNTSTPKQSDQQWSELMGGVTFDPNHKPQFGKSGNIGQSAIVKVEPNKPGQIAPLINRPKALAGAAKAQKKLLQEIQSNDDVIESSIRNKRMQKAAQEFQVPTSETQTTGMVEFREPQIKPQDLPVTPDEIQQVKMDAEASEMAARDVLQDVINKKPEKKKDIQSSVYWVDAVRSATSQPDGDNRLEKIIDNAKGVENGRLIYDVKSGRLFEPQGVVGSLMTGWKQKSQLFDDYSFFNNKTDEEIIAELERRRTAYDPDEPIPVPKHKVGELSQMVGSMPLKSIVAGTATSVLGAPQAAPFVSGAVGALDFYKMGYAGTLQSVYYQLREEGKSEQEALQIARSQAKKEGVVDAAVGGIASFAGMRFGAKPATFSTGYKSAISSFLKGAGKEGSLQSLIGAGGEIAKNKLAQAAGIKRETDQNVLQSIESNFLMTVGFAALAKLGSGIPKVKYKAILNGLKKVDNQTVENHLLTEINAGRMTEQQADNVRNELKTYKELDSQIPENVTEEARIEIQKKLEKKQELEVQMETLNKAFHEEVKEKITTLDEEIAELSKQREPRIKQDPEEKEAKLLIDDAIAEGVMTDVYGAMAKEDPKGFMKFVADQSFGRSEEGIIHEMGGTESQMREQFGDAIVDKAKEMFPLAEKKSSVSVIMPDEVKRPEVIDVGEPEVASQERGEQYLETPKKYTQSRANKELEQAPEIDLDLIDQEKSGMDYSKEEVRSVKLLEYRGENQNGERVGQVVIIGDGWVDTLDVKFKNKEVGGEKVSEAELKETGQEGGIIGEEKANEPNWVFGKRDGEPEMIGITHAEMDKVARELGLEEYSKDPESFDLWTKQAKDILAKEPDAINKLINKLRRGDMPSPAETQIMKMHIASLKKKYDTNPTPELLNEIKRTKDVYNISGRQEAKSLVARKGLIPVEDTLADFHMTDTEFNRAPLTEEQTAKSTAEYEKIKDIKEKFEAKIEELKSELAAEKAKKSVKDMAAKSKKSEPKDFAAERKTLLEKLKQQRDEHIQKMKDAGIQQMGGLGRKLVLTPEMLKTIGEIVRNVAEEVAYKFEDVVKGVHAQLKTVIDGITEKDVNDILAGEYTPKKKRSETAEKLFDLQTQAKLINKLEALEAGVQPKNEKQQIKRNREIEELRKKIGEHDLTKLKELKSRTRTELEKVKNELAQIDKGEIPTKPEKEEIPLDDEAKQLRDELLKAREERDIRLMQLDYDSRGKMEKFAREANQYLNISKQIKSTGDVSFPFRQGLVEVASKLLSVPFKIEKGKGIVFTKFEAQKKLLDSFGDMYSSLAKEKIYRRAMADIKESRWFEVAQEAGLKLADPNSPLAELREELHFPSKLEKIPVAKNIVKGSNRAASAFTNIMKFNKFVEFAEMFEKNGMTMKNSPDAYKEAAIYANQVLGRGFLGDKLESANWLTNRLFFSLRLQASRLQILFKAFNPQFWNKTPKEVRIEYLKDMIKTLALGAGVLTVANAAGLSVELDPRSSDFGKVKVGDTRYDVWGGFQQFIVMFSRILSGEYKTGDGKLKPLEPGKYKFGYDDLLKNFYRYKTSPEVGTGWNLISGERPDGEPVTLGGEALDFISPIVINDIKEAYKDGGVQRALLVWLLTAHGIGAQTYEDKEEKQDGGRGRRSERSERSKRETRQSR